MFEKLDLTDVVRDHYRTLVDHGTGKRDIGDLVVFTMVPVLVATYCAGLVGSMPASTSSMLITALSIFAGLLFNILVLIHALSLKSLAPTGADEARRMLQEIYANTAYAVLVALMAIAALTLGGIGGDGVSRRIADFAAITLSVHFTLTLMMVLKRLHRLLMLELGS